MNAKVLGTSIDKVLERFEQISSVPRGTKREQKISAWLQGWAKDHGFSSKTDSAGNLVIYIPASVGMENAPTIILQGHMDMVCEKTPDSTHDFTRDPIRLIRDGDWLKADRTTLGADNGIAIAMSLALAEDRTASHPPLELLFTVEEEIGIGGAGGLDPSLLSGKTMINLDSEEEGTFIVGCAGGKTTFITLPLSKKEPLPSDHNVLRLSISGLQGGHSGMEIDKHHASANKILARALDCLAQDVSLRLVTLKGGTARNAIAREAEAVFACPKESSDACRERIVSFEKEVRAEYAKSDGGLTLSLESEIGGKEAALNPADSLKIIRFLMALPHGVVYMSASVEGFVETSTNLAVLDLQEDGLHITTLQRSNVMSRLDEIDQRIEAIAQLAGAEAAFTEGYPAWQPNMDSPLLEKSVMVYETLFQQKPKVNIIHAGLECGVISDRCGGLDMISFGPTIKGAHSPDEKLYLPSVERAWRLLAELLRALA